MTPGDENTVIEPPFVKPTQPTKPIEFVPRLCLDLNCETSLTFEALGEPIIDSDDSYRQVVVGRLQPPPNSDSPPTRQNENFPIVQVSLFVDVLQRGEKEVLERETRMLVTANMLHQLSDSAGIAQILGSCQNGRRATSTYYVDAMASTDTRPLNVSLFLSASPSLTRRVSLVQGILDALLSLHRSPSGSISLLDMRPSSFLLYPNDDLRLFDFGLFDTSHASANCSLLPLDTQRDGQCQLVDPDDEAGFPAFRCPAGSCRGLAFNLLSACRALILPLLDSVDATPEQDVRWKLSMKKLRSACRSANVVGVFDAVSSVSTVVGRPYPAYNDHPASSPLL